MAEKRINSEAFKNALLKVWKTRATINIVEVGMNPFIVEFVSEGELSRIWDGQPWLFDQYLIYLKWFDGITPSKDSMFSHTYIWVQLHNLPFGCMNSDIGNKLGKSIGKMLHGESNSKGHGWGKFMCVLVELDLHQPLVRGKMLLLDGKTIFVAFKYEQLPKFCFRCGRIKHAGVVCPSKGVSKSEVL
ncbi:uncharacterized protein LOC121253429 [Juglans microcarpa x Juglans regia]|uniref:uncharacterized protein LOC121253429 n=1 Tax=Juglans microcarpa x Juglans regia TaxID=2249226 RepID=UPI001B7DC664|nr:uncharacterized protein LOC121253429 [Juglans microcarpa x Juglans regia]